MRKREYRANWCFRIAGILLCLTLASTYLVAGMYARYASYATGSDNARVALFSVTTAAASSLDEIKLTEDVPVATYSFTVTGKTETAWKYDIIVKQKDGERLPSGVTLTMMQTGVGISIPIALKETQQLGGYAYRAQSVQRVGPGDHEASYIIQFSADYNVLTETLDMQNIEISVLAEQTD